MKIFNLLSKEDKNFNLFPYVSFFWNDEYCYLNVGWFHICFQFSLKSKKSPTCVVLKNKWLRMIRTEDKKYIIQVRSLFKWKDVTFSPYGAYHTGISVFNDYRIAKEEYEKCLKEGKSYTLGGVVFNE